MQRDHHHEISHNGIWQGVIRFNCPWAHPAWSDYILLVYDLTSVGSGFAPAFKKDPSATHELMLFACDPNKPIDFSKKIKLAKSPRELTDLGSAFLLPANYGYQFKAADNAAAWARMTGLVDKIEAKALSPDTDFRSLWDAEFADGWTLHSFAGFEN